MKLENIKLTDFKNVIWPSVDKSNIQSLIDECNILANKGQLIGELLDDDYIIPMISIIDLRNVSHIITNLNIQEDGIYGDVKILDTPRGVALMSVFEQEFNAKFKFKIRATYLMPDIETKIIYITNISTWDIIRKSNLY